jgi:ABC-2 type transport system permease protein
MRKTTKIAVKEIRQLQRNPLVLVIALVMPAVMLGAACIAFSGELKALPIGLVNEDNGTSSSTLAYSIRSDSLFRVVWETTRYDRDSIVKALADGQVRAVICIPYEFSAELPQGGARIYVYLDGSDVLAANTISRAMKLITNPKPTAFSVDEVEFVLFNTKMSYENYILPAFYGIFLQSFPLMLQGMTVAVEKEKQTIEQLIVTPVGKLEILTGKLLVYFAVGLTNAFSMLFVMTQLFDVKIPGDPLAIVLVSAVFLLANLGIGTLGSVVAKSQLQAMQILLPIIYTSLFFTGTFYPVETLPRVVQPLAYFLPLTYMNHSLRLLMKGASVYSILGDIVALSSYSVITLALASALFRKYVD